MGACQMIPNYIYHRISIDLILSYPQFYFGLCAHPWLFLSRKCSFALLLNVHCAVFNCANKSTRHSSMVLFWFYTRLPLLK